MSQDRTVATDALEVLGIPNLGGKDVGRDAIHLAVEPGTAGSFLGVGQSIYRDAEDGLWYPCLEAARIAIVDPFLPQAVLKGERFLAVVPPRQITSLRHVWEHPAFLKEGETIASAPVLEIESAQTMLFTPQESEAWLREFISQADCPDYDTVIAVALGEEVSPMSGYEQCGGHWIDDEYLFFSGRDAHGEIPDEFWDHLENATGKKAPHRAKYFTCSC
jgi:hypothetical protein